MLNLLLSFLAALSFPTWISDSTISFSNSVFSLCLWIAVFLLLRAGGKIAATRRLNVCSHALGLLFSMMIAFGHALGDGWSAIPYGSLPFILSIKSKKAVQCCLQPDRLLPGTSEPVVCFIFHNQRPFLSLSEYHNL